MLQFYLLSVVLNVLSGFALYSERINTGPENPNRMVAALSGIFRDMTLRLMLGILTAITGFFKLLSVSPGDIPIIGDIVPAVAGLGMGFILILEYYRSKTGGSDEPARLETVFMTNKAILGIIGMIIGFIHFLFPSVLFL
jgi:hypothetical protein